jgi:hypothetical protein
MRPAKRAAVPKSWEALDSVHGLARQALALLDDPAMPSVPAAGPKARKRAEADGVEPRRTVA